MAVCKWQQSAHFKIQSLATVQVMYNAKKLLTDCILTYLLRTLWTHGTPTIYRAVDLWRFSDRESKREINVLIDMHYPMLISTRTWSVRLRFKFTGNIRVFDFETKVPSLLCSLEVYVELFFPRLHVPSLAIKGVHQAPSKKIGVNRRGGLRLQANRCGTPNA